MGKYLVAVDAGTTNTRATLWGADGVCAGGAKREVGVRNTAVDGNNRALKNAVRECVAEAMAGAAGDGSGGIGFDAVAAVYASGMITSNVGLVEVPHLAAPAGLADFVAGVRAVEMPEVAPLPIHFIPGVKNSVGAGSGGVTAENVEAMDMMRGEEVEVLALLHRFSGGKSSPGKPYLFVLPGSHTKFVAVDAAGRMTGCLSSLAGEILDLLTTRSILADAVRRSFVDAESYRREMVLRGFRVARRTSLARAAFSTRIMKQFVTDDPMDCANFLLGAVLEGDVAAVKGSGALRLGDGGIGGVGAAEVIVTGKEPLRSALAAVFEEDGTFARVENFAPEAGMSGFGAYLVARACGVFEECGNV